MPKRAVTLLDWWGRLKDAWEALPEGARKAIIGAIAGAVGAPMNAALAAYLGFWHASPALAGYMTALGFFGFGGCAVLVREAARALVGSTDEIDRIVDSLADETNVIEGFALDALAVFKLLAPRLAVGLESHSVGGVALAASEIYTNLESEERRKVNRYQIGSVVMRPFLFRDLAKAHSEPRDSFNEVRYETIYRLTPTGGQVAERIRLRGDS